MNDHLFTFRDDYAPEDRRRHYSLPGFPHTDACVSVIQSKKWNLDGRAGVYPTISDEHSANPRFAECLAATLIHAAQTAREWNEEKGIPCAPSVVRDEAREAWDHLPCSITDACEPDHAGDLVHAITVLGEEWAAEKERADENFRSYERIKTRYSEIVQSSKKEGNAA